MFNRTLEPSDNTLIRSVNITDLPSGTYSVAVYDTEDDFLENKTTLIAYPQFGRVPEKIPIFAVVQSSSLIVPTASSTPPTIGLP